MYGKDGRWYNIRHRSVGKQLEVYRYIQVFLDKNGYSPTLQEIAGAAGVTDTTARGYLKALESAGLIKRNGTGCRDFMVVAIEDFGRSEG